jgi:hypothetical protein
MFDNQKLIADFATFALVYQGALEFEGFGVTDAAEVANYAGARSDCFDFKH